MKDDTTRAERVVRLFAEALCFFLRVLLAAMTSHARLIKDVSLPTNQNPSQQCDLHDLSVEYFQCAFSRIRELPRYMRILTSGQWNYFRNGSPLCPSFYSLQDVTGYICNSNFSRISQRVSPVPKLLLLARRDGLHLQLQLFSNFATALPCAQAFTRCKT